MKLETVPTGFIAQTTMPFKPKQDYPDFVGRSDTAS
jgi:hypothetical protein